MKRSSLLITLACVSAGCGSRLGPSGAAPYYAALHDRVTCPQSGAPGVITRTTFLQVSVDLSFDDSGSASGAVLDELSAFGMSSGRTETLLADSLGTERMVRRALEMAKRCVIAPVGAPEEVRGYTFLIEVPPSGDWGAAVLVRPSTG